MEMNLNEIPDKRKAFVGIDCGYEKMRFTIVNTYGRLLSSGVTSFPKDTSKLGEHIVFYIKAMRGGANVRTKNFAGIGISFANPDINIINLEQQITQIMNIPVAVGNYDNTKQVGEDWLKKVGDNSGIEKIYFNDMAVAYGAVKLVKEKTSSTSLKNL